MRHRNLLACFESWLIAAALVGCGQSPSPSTSARAPEKKSASTAAADDSKPAVQVARAETKLPATTAPEPEAEPADETPATPSASLSPAPAELPKDNGAAPLDDPEAATLTMPKVMLSEGHTKTCLVNVGDTLPEITLADLAGQEQTVAKLLGPKLTVVFFWNGSRSSALEELRDLSPDVAKRFGNHGVKVVGISSQQPVAEAGESAKAAVAEYPILSDADGAVLQKLTSGKIPRTYLVDSSGKILWLDLEYSRSTRRDLQQAIRYALAHPQK